jgi:hypothetical protein
MRGPRGVLTAKKISWLDLPGFTWIWSDEREAGEKKNFGDLW